MAVPFGSSRPRAVLRTSDSVRTPWARGANWTVGLAAAVLLVVSVGGYLYHREQLVAIAAEHMRLRVTGPATLHAGVAAGYAVTTTTITGMPMPAQIELALHAPDGEQLFGHNEVTDEDGRLWVTISTERDGTGKPPPSCAVLSVVATCEDKRQEVQTRLAVEPVHYSAWLTVDKPLYRPGETIYYRALILSRFTLSTDQQMPIHFKILGPEESSTAGGSRIISSVAGSEQQGLTRHGIASGAFALPDELPEGEYLLTVRGLDGALPEQRRPFVVRRYRLPGMNEELQLTGGSDTSADAGVADEGGNREAPYSTTPVETIPGGSGRVEVSFHPEGGDLVAGLENRVYFVGRDGLGKPVHIEGTIVDSAGIHVAGVETVHRGRGSFSFVPRPEQRYRLKITSPADLPDQPELPEVNAERNVVLNTGTGVFDAGRPLEFNIRASEADVPLVVSAWCRGAPVGQRALVTRVEDDRQNGAHAVTIPLAEQVGGAIRLAVHDYSSTPPELVAERLVYRRMGQRLNVHVSEHRRQYSPGERVDLSLLVTDEKGEPVPAAALGVAVIDAALLRLADAAVPAMPTGLLLCNELENPELEDLKDLEDADFYLSDDPEAAVALDLLLGTQGRCRFKAGDGAEKTPHRLEKEGQDDDTPTRPLAVDRPDNPPAMFDNLGEIQAKYQQSLDDYRAGRTKALNTLTTLSFFGGLGLMLLVAMLGLLKVVSGVYLWVPAVGATMCSLVIGVILMDPARLTSGRAAAVPFLPFHLEPPESAVGNSGALDRAEQEADVSDEEDTRSGPELLIDGAAIGARDEYAHVYHDEESRPRNDFAETLFWHPLVVTDNNGRANISFDLCDSITTFRLRIDAHGDRRIGSGQGELISRIPPDLKP